MRPMLGDSEIRGLTRFPEMRLLIAPLKLRNDPIPSKEHNELAANTLHGSSGARYEVERGGAPETMTELIKLHGNHDDSRVLCA